MFLLFFIWHLFCHRCVVCQLLLSHFTDHGMSFVEVNSLAGYRETFLTSGDFQHPMPKNLFKGIVYQRILNLKNWEQRWEAKYVVMCEWNLQGVSTCQYIFVDFILLPDQEYSSMISNCKNRNRYVEIFTRIFYLVSNFNYRLNWSKYLSNCSIIVLIYSYFHFSTNLK